jgi:anti-anti-sigma factor
MPTNPDAVPAAPLKLQISTSDGATLVKCLGRLTADVSVLFKDEIKMLIPGAKQVTLDLSGITFMDSSGLGAVVKVYVTAKKSKCELRLVNLTPRVRELLGMTHLLDVFEPLGQFPIRMV